MKENSKKERHFLRKRPLFSSFHNTRVGANGEDAVKNRIFSIGEAARLREAPSYAIYLFRLFRGGSVYSFYRRARSFVLPALFLSRAFRILRLIFRIAETGAVLLLLSSLLLVLLPPFSLVALVFSILAAIDRRRCDRRFAGLFVDRPTVVIFHNEDGRFADLLAAELAARYTVLLVTDFPKQIMHGTPMPLVAAARLRPDGVLVAREHYFFRLRRRILGSCRSLAVLY